MSKFSKKGPKKKMRSKAFPTDGTFNRLVLEYDSPMRYSQQSNSNNDNDNKDERGTVAS